MNSRTMILLCCLFLFAAPMMVSGQVDLTMRIDPTILQGTASTEVGEVLLFTPDPPQPGSSITHWDTSASPNLLMEPNISSDLPFLGLDITPGLMDDIGWPQGTSMFNIIDLDPEGTGFTDPADFPGAPGNPATTLGEARLNLFTGVLNAWGDRLGSSVEIDVLVTWAPLPCTMGVGAALAGALPLAIIREDAPSELFEFGDTWYPVALAEAIAGSELNEPGEEPEGGDILIIMNSLIDQGCLAEDTGFYYGFDNDSPPSRLNFSSVVLHELAHGLGMSNFTDERDGLFIAGFPSIYDRNIYDLSRQATWAEMTAEERVSSAVNHRGVAWKGDRTTEMAAMTLNPGTPVLEVLEPNVIAGGFLVEVASFGAPLDEMGIEGELACAFDGFEGNSLDPDFPGNSFDACQPLLNAAEIEGRIALIERGNCSFASKVAHAEAAGASGAVVVNPFSNTIVAMGGDTTTGIPAVSLGRQEGEQLQSLVCPEEPAAVFTQWIDGNLGSFSNLTRIIIQNPRMHGDAGQVLLETGQGDLAFDVLEFGVPAGGVRSFETPGVGALMTGIAEVRSYLGADSGLVASAALTVLDGSITIPDSAPLLEQQLYVSFREDERTAVALYNPDPVFPILVEAELRDGNGVPVEVVPFLLDPEEQLSVFLDEEPFFPEFLTAIPLPFEGTVRFTVLEGSGLSALGLIQKDNGAIFSVSTRKIEPVGEGLEVVP